ncbi:hypothetical protein QVD17_06351 [Tagetes erecta]|uniref:F-box/LRR-repeat protein 15/At3g58940/PEG3-like LRR domain-containing protein n=1 Tax=Tagetes erecta TaxID=13708 RepID=A0AAD8PB80_TARER|nr:hypothetical protein QVD17_06351 [Tagetes erecta]
MSVLSNTWFHLTASFPILDFRIYHFRSRQSFFKYVEYATSRFCCHNNVAAQRLKIIATLQEPAEVDIVNTCIELVLNRGLTELEINFTNFSGLQKYRLPDVLLSVSMLRSLIICGCDLPSSFMVNALNFKSLLQLTLDRVSINDEAIKYLITSCPLLELLKIRSCRGLKRFCVFGHQNLQKVWIYYITPVERIDIVEAPNLSCIVIDQGGRGAPRMNVSTCKKLTNVAYINHPGSNAGHAYMLSNFPFIVNLILNTRNNCNNLKFSSHSLRTLVLLSTCDLENIEFTTPNLVLFIYSRNDRLRSSRLFTTLWPLGSHYYTRFKGCMHCYPDGYIDALWFHKLRLFLAKNNGFKVFNLYIEAMYRQAIALEKLKAIELSPYELEHVELELDPHEESSAHIAFVHAILWCCRPRSLTLRSSLHSTDLGEQSDIVKFTYNMLLQQEDKGHTNIQIVSASSSKVQNHFKGQIMSLSWTQPREVKAISFIKEKGPKRKYKTSQERTLMVSERGFVEIIHFNSVQFNSIQFNSIQSSSATNETGACNMKTLATEIPGDMDQLPTEMKTLDSEVGDMDRISELHTELETLTIDIDRISELPDFIIHHILSLIPPWFWISLTDWSDRRLDRNSQLVRMSVLSKKWFHLTASFPILDFNLDNFTELCRQCFFKYVEYATSRFCHHNVTAHTFKLKTTLLDPAELYIVNRCIELVLKNGVRELVIDVFDDPYAFVKPLPKYRLPNMLLSVSMLKSLTIHGCHLPSSLMVDGVRFKSLIKLSLENVSIDDEVIKYLTTSCPLLQELKITSCEGLKRFCVYGHQNLQKVGVYYKTRVERIDIEAPNLFFLLVADLDRRGAPVMNVALCKKLTTVCYNGYPLPNSNGFTHFLSNFPFIENFCLNTEYDECNLKLSSHSLRKLVMSSEKCDLKEFEFGTPNLVEFNYSCYTSTFWLVWRDMVQVMVRKSTKMKPCMQWDLLMRDVTLSFQKLRLFLEKTNGFKISNLRFNAIVNPNIEEFQKLKEMELPPYELENVVLDLLLGGDGEVSDLVSFVDAVLCWFCPRSLTLESFCPLPGFEDVAKFTYKKLLEQEGESHTKIQIMSSKTPMQLEDLMSLSRVLSVKTEISSKMIPYFTFIALQHCCDSVRDDGIEMQSSRIVKAYKRMDKRPQVTGYSSSPVTSKGMLGVSHSSRLIISLLMTSFFDLWTMTILPP